MTEHTRSGFSNVDKSEDPSRYVRKLFDTGSRQIWQAIKQQMLANLEIAPDERALDVGCGIGADTLAMASRVGPTGIAIGIDHSETMIHAARAGASGSNHPAVFCRADAQNLCFEDQTFDACRCERVLQHLRHPERALAEMVRVSRPAARIAVVEPDYGGVSIHGADRHLTRKLLGLRRAHYVSPTFARDIGNTLKTLGVEKCGVTILKDDQRELPDWYRESLRRIFVEPARLAGIITKSEGELWLEDLRRAAEMCQFCHSTPIFLVFGRRS